MSHPAVAAAFAHVTRPQFIERDTNGKSPAALARRLHPYWNDILLASAFTKQISATYTNSQWRDQAKLDTARREVARRTSVEIGRKGALLLQRADQLARQSGADVSAMLAENPLAPGRFPTQLDLEALPGSTLVGAWSDAELIGPSIALLLNPVMPPFGLKVKDNRRTEALQSTFNVVRRHRGELSDNVFAGSCALAADWARDGFPDSAFPWAPVLIGAGVVLLAATGVGLAVAAPAGLAGAAAITSTLAAFGPGGMVGGIATLGALTSAAASTATMGVTVAGSSDGPTIKIDISGSASELAPLHPAALKGVLQGMVAIPHAQLSLGFDSTEPVIRLIILQALDLATAEHAVHRVVAPDSEECKACAKSRELLRRAVRLLDELNDLSTVTQMRVAAGMLKRGRLTEGERERAAAERTQLPSGSSTSQLSC